MDNSMSPNYYELVFEKKNEGKTRLLRTLTVCGYVLFILGFFIFCMSTKLLPLFAIGPLLLYILVLCTWRLVKHDYYLEFSTGNLTAGVIKVSKQGRRKMARVSVHIKDAEEIAPYTGRSMLAGIRKIYNYSSSERVEKRICIIFSERGASCALIVDWSERLASLLTSFCQNAHDIKKW